jgi:hypothetical protein
MFAILRYIAMPMLTLFGNDSRVAQQVIIAMSALLKAKQDYATWRTISSAALSRLMSVVRLLRWIRLIFRRSIWLGLLNSFVGTKPKLAPTCHL